MTVEFSDDFLSYSLLGISIFNAIISFISIAKLIWLFKTDKSHGWNVSKVVHCMIPFTVIPMSMDQFYYYMNDMATFYFLESYQDQDIDQMAFDAIPGYVFISVYILLCLFWLEVYPTVYMEREVVQSRLRKVYIIINAVLYSFWFTFLMLVGLAPKHIGYIAHMTEAWFTLSVSSIMGILYLVVGTKLYFRLSKMGVKSPSALHVAKKVGLLTAIFSLVFILRAPLIYVGFFHKYPPVANYIIHIFFPVVLTGIPTLLVIFLLGNKSKPSTEYARINAQYVSYTSYNSYTPYTP